MILSVPSLTCSLRKQPTFGDVTTGFPAKWLLRNDRRNSTLMGRHYPDLGSASDWSCRVGNLFQPIISTTQILVVTPHQYGISEVISQTSFGGETTGSVANCRLFSQATWLVDRIRVKKDEKAYPRAWKKFQKETCKQKRIKQYQRGKKNFRRAGCYLVVTWLRLLSSFDHFSLFQFSSRPWEQEQRIQRGGPRVESHKQESWSPKQFFVNVTFKNSSLGDPKQLLKYLRGQRQYKVSRFVQAKINVTAKLKTVALILVSVTIEAF